MSDVAQIRAAATAKPESGFDEKTGELRLGGVVYKPQRYTRKLRVEHKKLKREMVPLDKQIEANRITAKYQTDGDGKVTGVREPLTSEEAAFMDELGDLSPDLAYHALGLLYKDADGNALPVDLAMDELVDEEAADAEEWVTANPTGRKTNKSGS